MHLPLWCSPRLLWALGGIATLLALAPGIHAGLALAVLAAIALVVLVAVDYASGPRAQTLVVRRILPEHLALRSPATFSYVLENHSSQAVRARIAEAPIRTLRFGEPVAIEAPAWAQTTVCADALPVARGVDTLGALYVWYENRIGLLRRRVRIEAVTTIRVYPDLSAVERYGTLHARNRLIEAGLRRMRMRGVGTEFESLREYADGDPFRAIDWKASARRGKTMVVQREVERSQDVVLLLDCGRLMTARIDEQRKLDYAVTAALSVASIASLAHDRIGVVAFAREILLARAPRATGSSVHRLSQALCDVEPIFEEADYARAFAYVRAHLHRRSLIVLFTDVIDPLSQSTVLGELASLARHHVVVCAFMNDAAVATAVAVEPRSVDDAYRLDVALGLLHERKVAAGMLERAGVHVIDVPARSLSVATIDEYLKIKQRALL